MTTIDKQEYPQERKTVFATPWFQVLAAPAPDGGQPHYVIQGADFVVIVAVTESGQMLLVRQFRVAAAAITLELPAGHVDPGETPEQAARRQHDRQHESLQFQRNAFHHRRGQSDTHADRL